MKQGLVQWEMYEGQENHHLEWPDHAIRLYQGAVTLCQGGCREGWIGTAAFALHQMVNKASLPWCHWRPYVEPGLPSYMVVMTHLASSLLEWHKEGLEGIKNFYNHSAAMRLSSQCISISQVNMGSRYLWSPHRELYFHHFLYITEMRGHLPFLTRVVSEEPCQKEIFNHDPESH